METRTRSSVSLAQRRQTMLAVSAIHPNPDQPRKHFDQNDLDELATSIQTLGVLQALIVRARSRSPNSYTIVVGERRWRAAKQIGMDRVPCIVLQGLDDEQAYILATTENVARANMDVIEEAEAYAHIGNLGRSVDEVAKLFGKTADYIRYRLDLLDLRDDVQHLVARGQLGVGPAWHISRLSVPGQTEVLGKLNAGEFATDDHTIRYADAVRMREESPEMFAAAATTESAFDSERRRTHRTRIERAWEKVQPLASNLGPFLECSAEELAAALGPDTQLYEARLDVLAKTVRRVLHLTRQAAAIHAANPTPKKAKR